MPHRMANSRGHGKRQRHDDIDKRGFAGDSRQRDSGPRPLKRPRFQGPGGGWQEEGQVSQSRSFDNPTPSHGAPFGSAGLHQQDQWEQVPQSYVSGRVPMGKTFLFFYLTGAEFNWIFSPRGTGANGGSTTSNLVKVVYALYLVLNFF